ncbi:hypothetical protein VaNZ11_006786 [Volvox africanus]|uniref:Uncharacterized protein n=1 Tax=Volvox africanus TaxID=51714 RepID=A0ABQ5S1T9_9CHLO|nr:hypothetical protein VaNZ11_006786 [Volvox africanus]
MALFVAPQWRPVGVDMARCCAENSPAPCETAYLTLPLNMFSQAMPAAMPIPCAASSFPFPSFFPTFLPIAGALPAVFYNTANGIGASSCLHQNGHDHCLLDPPSESSASTGAPATQQQRTSDAYGVGASSKPSRIRFYRSGDSASRTSLRSCCGTAPAAHLVVPSAVAGNPRLSEVDLDPGSVWPNLHCPSELCDTDTEGLLATDVAVEAVPPVVPVVGPQCAAGAVVSMQMCPLQPFKAPLAPAVAANLPAHVSPRGNYSKTQHSWGILNVGSSPAGKEKAFGLFASLLKEESKTSSYVGEEDADNADDDGLLRVDGLDNHGMPSPDGLHGGVDAEPLGRGEERSCGRVLLRGATGALVWVDTRRHRAIGRRQHRRQRLMRSGQLPVASSPCNRKSPGSVSRHGLPLLCNNPRASGQLPEEQPVCSHDGDDPCCSCSCNCKLGNGPKVDVEEAAADKGGSCGLCNAAGTAMQVQLNVPTQRGYVGRLEGQTMITPRAPAPDEYHTLSAAEGSFAAVMQMMASTAALRPAVAAVPAAGIFAPAPAAASAVLPSPWLTFAEGRVDMARTALEVELQAVLAEETGILDVSEDLTDDAGCNDAGNDAGDPIVPAFSSAPAPAVVP